MRCLAKEDIGKITKAYHDIFFQQSAWKKSADPRTYLKNIFLRQKYSPKDVDACLENHVVQAGLMKEQQRAMIEMRIISMPAFVIGENVHQGVLSAEELAKMCGLEDASSSMPDKTVIDLEKIPKSANAPEEHFPKTKIPTKEHRHLNEKQRQTMSSSSVKIVN
jgi:hypothetical protein